ncbi:MAG: glucose-6-phosphate dehydrogenase [Candidatus Dormibacteraceae bacterium]
MTAAPDLAANPLSPGLHEYRVADPALMVIFGATGDLAARKLLPSIYNLAAQRLLPPGFAVVGAAKDRMSADRFRDHARAAIREHSRTQPVDEDVLGPLAASLDYQVLDFADGAGFERLKRTLDDLDRDRDTGGRRIYYCATPPVAFPTIVDCLGKSGMGPGGGAGWRRIVVEKPFGHDLDSAQELNRVVARVFTEDQVYRIDHYLGKETVQNILAFRFANSIFEPIWNSQYVDSIQITVAEELGVEGRGAYYETAGALRDIVQNHLLQLLTLVAMEPPVAYDHVALRDEKIKVLRAVAPLRGDEIDRYTVRGQYREGWVMGEKAPGYRQESKVSRSSDTETYAALRISIANWRWEGVPFYLRTGKRLPKRVTEIRVQFKRPPHLTFGAEATRELEPNSIVLRIQPEEGISLRFGAKVPTPGIRIRSVNMDFLYMSSFVADAPDAYERLLIECMLGDPTHFIRSDEVEAAWRLIDPIEERWSRGRPKLVPYPAGEWGPESADELLAREGREWHRI